MRPKRPRRAAAGSSLRAEINVTPLVDVVLVLLIIFMVVTPFLRHGVDVALPFASHGEEERDQGVVVTVRADGSTWLSAERVERAELTERVRTALGAYTRREVVVRGDGDLRYATVRDLFEDLRAAGASDVRLATTEPEGD